MKHWPVLLLLTQTPLTHNIPTTHRPIQTLLKSSSLPHLPTHTPLPPSTITIQTPTRTRHTPTQPNQVPLLTLTPHQTLDPFLTHTLTYTITQTQILTLTLTHTLTLTLTPTLNITLTPTLTLTCPTPFPPPPFYLLIYLFIVLSVYLFIGQTDTLEGGWLWREYHMVAVPMLGRSRPGFLPWFGISPHPKKPNLARASKISPTSIQPNL